MQTKWNISLFHYRNHGAGTHNSISIDSGMPLFYRPTTRAVQILARFLLEFKCRQPIAQNSMIP